MLSKKELTVLNGLLEKKDFKGKKALRFLIWLNTSVPEFQIGDIVTVTNKSMRICDTQVVNWTGIVREIYSTHFEDVWKYKVEVYYIVNGEQRSTVVFNNENVMKRSNQLEIKSFNYDGKYEECIDL